MSRRIEEGKKKKYQTGRKKITRTKRILRSAVAQKIPNKRQQQKEPEQLQEQKGVEVPKGGGKKEKEGRGAGSEKEEWKKKEIK